jgi:hypothetical protein
LPRRGGEPGYASLSTAEKWQWHAHLYAFRRVYLGVPDHIRTSPCDEGGVWYDEAMVAAEVARVRAVKARKDGTDQPFAFTDEELDERAEWARVKGYPSWDAFLAEIQATIPLSKVEFDPRVAEFRAWADERRDRLGPPSAGTYVRDGRWYRNGIQQAAE